MCAVSMVYDSYRQVPFERWVPEPRVPQPWVSEPPASPLGPIPNKVDEFKQIIERLDRLDKALGLPECHDPAKAAWLKDIEARLARLENQKPTDQPPQSSS